MLRRDFGRLLIAACFVPSILSDAAAQSNLKTGGRPNVVLILEPDGLDLLPTFSGRSPVIERPHPELLRNLNGRSTSGRRKLHLHD